MKKIFIIDNVAKHQWHDVPGYGKTLKVFAPQDHIQALQEVQLDRPDLVLINSNAISINELGIQLLIEIISHSEDAALLVLRDEQLSAFKRDIVSHGHFSLQSLLGKPRFRPIAGIESPEQDNIINPSVLLRNLERKSKALLHVEYKSQLLLDNCSDGIIEYDNIGQITYLNKKAQNLLGFSLSELLDSSVFDLFELAQNHSDFLISRRKLSQNMLDEKNYNFNKALLRTSLGATIVADVSCHSVADKHDSCSYMMIFQDITSQTNTQQQLMTLSQHDRLTSLSNRDKFHRLSMAKIDACAKGNKSNKLAVLFIDIDHFKNINDSMGHDAGDELLIETATRLRGCIADKDLLARISGDEFAITLSNITSMTELTQAVQNILQELGKPMTIQSQQLSVSASIGISLYPDNGNDIKTLSKTADTAMHQAKKDGRNTYRYYSTEIQNRAMEQVNLESAMRQAIANNEFCLYYQPQIDLSTGAVSGLEALIRWQHPDWPGISPAQFIPVAEQCGLLPSIGEWVLLSACQQTVQWDNNPDIDLFFPISINLSPTQLLNNDFVHLLKQVLKETHLPASKLVFELTETAIMKNPEAAMETLRNIAQQGSKLSIDDFGTGYSSLSFLQQLPISKLKIDRSFIDDIGVDNKGEALVKSILMLAHNLNLQSIAEGVTQQQQVDFLKQHKCDQIQGFFYSEALPVDEITTLLQQEKLKHKKLSSEINTANSITNSESHLH